MIKIKTKNILILIVLFIFIILVLSVSSGIIGSNLNDNSINESNNDLKQINGRNITINLDSNPSTGYHWEVSNETQGVKLVSRTFISDNNDENLVGVGGVERFIFNICDSKHYFIKINEFSPSGEIANIFIQSDLINATLITNK